MLKRILKLIIKIFMGLFGGIIGLFVLGVVGLTVVKHFKFSDYYKIRSREALNAGLNDGYVPQGCTYDDDNNYFLTVGYMKDGSVSRIYKIDKKNKKTTYYTLTSDGAEFLGHTGGLQYAKGYLYLANEGDGIYKFSADSLKDNKAVEIGKPIKVNNHSSFVFSDDDYLYVGEFNDDNKYACSNEISYNGKTHKAIVSKYKLGNLNKPVEIYSIDNQIQGFAVTADGTIVLSRSYGLSSSNFYIFKPDSFIKTNIVKDGAKVIFLDKDNCSKNMLGPAMSEDLDYMDGKVIYLSESACNKYIFGKLFFDYFIYGLKI